MKNNFLLIALFAGLIGLTACNNQGADKQKTEEGQDEMDSGMTKLAEDPHSFSKPNDVRVKHLSWNAEVNFETKKIDAVASWDLENYTGADKVIFDTHELDITKVTDAEGNELEYEVGEQEEHLGSPLTIQIGENTEQVNIAYTTSPNAGALLWVEGEDPFLFSQSQAILARTWIPTQDSPGVRFTYDAEVAVPKNLMALMSAENPQEKNETGTYNFRMEQPIPAYLLALAAGNVEFRAIGDRTGVYAVPELIDEAEYEFQEMDDMLKAAEDLYGKYAWGRYDLLILPAAFPFGGMENPRLTFATPTIIAGDRSLTALVAHELAHSWSGNLVTNSTWDDFWLNEGFTVYFEQRIMEEVYGREYSEMLAELSLQGLKTEVKEISEEHPADTHLKLELEGRDPDAGMTAIAYDKGYFFLRLLEETVGRERFDAFLNEYFSSHAFKVMDTERFVDYLKEELLTKEEQEEVNLEAWIYGPGLPENLPEVGSDKIATVDSLINTWSAGKTATKELPWNDWAYQQKYRFLTNLPESVTAEKLAELDETYSVTQTGNNEVLFAWLEQSILKNYEKAYPRVEEFLINVGRRKFLTPLYSAMKETGKMDMALSIYEKARPNYHSVATGTMDELLNWEEEK
ncbi:M1 family metallopeptidase [Halocola ammonii]